MRRKFVGFLFQVESLGLCWLPTPGGTNPRSLESGSAHQIPEVLPLKDGKICPNAATSAVFYHGLLNYGSFGCDVSDRKGKMSSPEVVGEVVVTGAVAGEASLLVDEAGAVQEVGVVGAHPGAGVVGVEEGGEEEAWVEERRLW